MENAEIIKELLVLEALGKNLTQRSRIIRQMLEADSSATSTLKGKYDALVAKAIADWDMRMAKKYIKNSIP